MGGRLERGFLASPLGVRTVAASRSPGKRSANASTYERHQVGARRESHRFGVDIYQHRALADTSSSETRTTGQVLDFTSMGSSARRPSTVMSAESQDSHDLLHRRSGNGESQHSAAKAGFSWLERLPWRSAVNVTRHASRRLVETEMTEAAERVGITMEE